MPAGLQAQIPEREKEKRGLVYGTSTYWDALFNHLSVAFWVGNELLIRNESPRTFFKLVKASINNKKEQSFFPELENEKTLKKLMLACNDGEHAERADCNEYCFFEVADASRAKAEKLKVTS